MMEVPLAAQAADEPNRMFICTGRLQTNWTAYGNPPGVVSRESFTALIQPNPPLGRRQFHRAVAIASVAQVQMSDWDASDTDSFYWGIEEAQADLDDETDQAELRVMVAASASGQQTYITIGQVAFQVTILARV